ncbi:hypothetical protein GCM10017608_18020 [Agromyces luteolus]|uniref:Uncharacterized protein n=1 Tax=Agromyces luteolus TaxID=88373 RepID=A0A7C9LU35_9MICO|nr:hypothetical protein [Agromyces luteolus]MUN08116.1 hypothetical protein [Agromyces luteolus]GLK27868.1 hypothetical protein GCM10017608_18020 [Agromyces luteolus]
MTADDARPHDRRGALLAEAREAAARRRPVDLLAQWADDATVAASAVDLRTSVALDALALESAPGYDAVLLSPVAPLGASSVMAPTSQDRVLSTIRPVEVVSDPTNVLALEAARRVRAAPGEPVRLCTVHQVLRMQPVPPGHGHTRHFRLFALADAGRAEPSDAFEVRSVVAHLAVHRRVIDAASARFGFPVGDARAIVRADPARPALGDRVAEAIAGEFPDVRVDREALDGSYYDGLRVGYGVAVGGRGEFREIVDIGRVRWVGELVGDRRVRFVTSAIGLQLLATFGAGRPSG